MPDTPSLLIDVPQVNDTPKRGLENPGMLIGFYAPDGHEMHVMLYSHTNMISISRNNNCSYACFSLFCGEMGTALDVPNLKRFVITPRNYPLSVRCHT